MSPVQSVKHVPGLYQPSGHGFSRAASHADQAASAAAARFEFLASNPVLRPQRNPNDLQPLMTSYATSNRVILRASFIGPKNLSFLLIALRVAGFISDIMAFVGRSFSCDIIAIGFTWALAPEVIPSESWTLLGLVKTASAKPADTHR